MKIPSLYGYAVMATRTTVFYHGGQYAFFRLKRDAIAWRDKNYPTEKFEVSEVEIRNAVLRVSVF